VKLFICYGTFQTPRPGGHPCANAAKALRAAGHAPEFVKTYGFGALPDALNGPRRAEVKRLTGSSWVPVLELDDGTTVSGSDAIAGWAAANPAGTAAQAT
jgi:glutathione S-transferase